MAFGFYQKSFYIEECHLEQIDLRAHPFLVLLSHLEDVLHMPFSVEEVRKAMFSMDPYKSPKSDSFQACFYQNGVF